MQLPFTVDQFLEVFKNYNEAVFPIQIIFYLIAFYVLYLIFKPTGNSSRIISGVLAFFWLWIGIFYHLIYFTKINGAAYFFGMIFLIQGILFIVYGVVKDKITLSYRKNGFNFIGILFILYALIIYPLLGYLFGHRYPVSPTFGLPCPTTIFTFGVLLFLDRKISAVVLIIPLLWSLIGFSAALKLTIYEDIGLLVAGVVGFVLILIHNKKTV